MDAQMSTMTQKMERMSAQLATQNTLHNGYPSSEKSHHGGRCLQNKNFQNNNNNNWNNDQNNDNINNNTGDNNAINN